MKLGNKCGFFLISKVVWSFRCVQARPRLARSTSNGICPIRHEGTKIWVLSPSWQNSYKFLNRSLQNTLLPFTAYHANISHPYLCSADVRTLMHDRRLQAETRGIEGKKTIYRRSPLVPCARLSLPLVRVCFMKWLCKQYGRPRRWEQLLRHSIYVRYVRK